MKRGKSCLTLPPDRQPNSAPRRRFQANLEIAKRPLFITTNAIARKLLVAICRYVIKRSFPRVPKSARVIVVKQRTSFGIGELLALRARAMAAL